MSELDVLEKIQKDGWALRYVKEQTPELCLAAVQQNGFAVQFVKEQSIEICLAAVQQYGTALRYVREQTPEICLEAKSKMEELCSGWKLKHNNTKKYVLLL